MWFDTDFGVNNAGIATVGYREVNNVGGDAVARTTVGVVDAGNGQYGVDVTPNANTVSLQWDTGTAFPIYAVESINQFTILDDKVDIIDSNVDLILLDTTQLLLDVAGVKAVVDLIFIDTTQLLLDVAALNAQNVLILADTSAIIAQNVLILIDTTQILLDLATVDANVDQILLDTTQLLLDTTAILADTNAILLDTANINLLLTDIEDGRDIREILRLVVASAVNILSGAEPSSTTIILKSLDGLKNRQVTTVDINGNRTAIISRDFTP